MSVLQREVERLSHALLKAEEEESVLKEKMSSLRMSLQEAAASQSAQQSRLAALQKMLAEAERDRRLLQVSQAGEEPQPCRLETRGRVSVPTRSNWRRLVRQRQRGRGARLPSLSVSKAYRAS